MIPKEEYRRRICSSDRLRLLKKLGYRTGGDEDSLEKILNENNFKTPGYYEETHAVINNDEIGKKTDVYYGYSINGCVFVCPNYADALAQEIIDLHENKML